MRKELKSEVVESLTEKLSNTNVLYVTDTAGLTVEEVNNLRQLCYNGGITLQVAKNTLAKRAMEACDTDFAELYDSLTGPTALMFAEVGNAPAKVIKKFREGSEKPILKAAYIDTAVYVGDDQVESLAALKSKEELIGEVISLLQSPMKNLISSLQSGKNNLSGVLKALENRTESE